MTEFSLRVLLCPLAATNAELESYALDAPLAQDLRVYARDVGPYALADWANSHKKALYYVDDCWVRARVSGSDIPIFFAEVLGKPELDREISPDGVYLIEAEEY